MLADETSSELMRNRGKGAVFSPQIVSAFWIVLTVLACAGGIWSGVSVPVVLAAGVLCAIPAGVDLALRNRTVGSDIGDIWVVFAWLGLAFVAVWGSGAALSPLTVFLALGPLHAFSLGRYRLGVEASAFSALGFIGISALDVLGYGLPEPGGLGLLPGLGTLIAILQIGMFIAAAKVSIGARESDRRTLQAWESTLWGVPVLILRLDQNGHIINWLGNPKVLSAPDRMELTRYGVVDIFTNSNEIRSIDGKPIILHPVWNETRALETRLLKAPGGYRMVLSPVTEAYERAMELNSQVTEREEAIAGQAKWVASLGHELRNMLNPVSGYTDLIMSERAGEIGESNKAFAASIKQGAEHLSLLVEDLMTATKSRAGHLNLSPEMLDLREEIEGAIRLIQWQAGAAQVNVLMTDGADLNVFADRKALRQILINLLSNAIKYSKPNGKVTVSAHSEDGMVSIVVRDEGEGMSPHDLAQIGEAFFQGENAKGKVGTGLGLTIVKMLTDAMHGKFEIASELGKGTVVAIWLPPEEPSGPSL